MDFISQKGQIVETSIIIQKQLEAELDLWTVGMGAVHELVEIRLEVCGA